MHFSSGINRPPYETADGYLQTTQGCSHNSCLFCTYFKEPPFRKSPIEEIYELVRCLTNDTIFMNEHASNLFHVRCRIPEQKEALLACIKQFMESHDEKALRRYREQITRAF